ncbi:MAG: tRNA glutamyl-Q(34) synthetase GluQRS [Rhodobacter sp.]|nr:tRNA glutamyl-Q(34) synthetase GluQRS [Rhodobacter sp.]MCY4169660.1 tRNA glutamyl-Q(34) synthetase GluQRS [Rhodobacter sp.]MCY4242880.1 tRNA glutamyl-Q(34) synthetase GluQRS [Rhodobacter sp.]
MNYITRFAPSPTGPLHLGHAFSAITASDQARANGGKFILRIEDIDPIRSKPHWENRIFEDLRWLGLDWPEPVLRQSDRLSSYREALDQLIAMGVCYPCRCSRRDIRTALSAPQEDSRGDGSGGPVYPGTCRFRSMSDAGAQDSIRLNVASALDLVGRTTAAASPARMNKRASGSNRIARAAPSPGLLAFTEVGPIRTGIHRIMKEATRSRIGDIVLARRDIGTSYHLAVVVDDAEQGVTEVVRGEDLFEATFLHVLLQDLLALPRPTYFHHPLVRDESGKRLAKRDDARSLARYREDGLTSQEVRRMAG